MRHQRLQKCILNPPASSEPARDHLLEHALDLQIRQLQRIFCLTEQRIKLIMYHFQIPAGQKKTPDGVILISGLPSRISFPTRLLDLVLAQ